MHNIHHTEDNQSTVSVLSSVVSMSRKTYIFSTILFFLLFYPCRANAALQSNLKDPGMTRADWQTRNTQNGTVMHAGTTDPTCKSSDIQTWLLNSVDVTGSLCNSQPNNPMKATWTDIEGGKSVTLTLDNSKNASSLQCTSVRNFLGIGAPFGYKRLYYYPQLTKLMVRANIKNDVFTSACTTGNCSPTCFSDPGRFNPQGHGWVNLIIGLPMYDETHNRNLWIELVIYDTPGWYNIRTGAAYNPQDPAFANGTYFYGNSDTEEFYRIYVTQAYVNDHTWLDKGQEHLYNIDFLSIINSIKNSNGWKSNIDWQHVHFSDAYIGTELFGDSKAKFTVSRFDILFEEIGSTPTAIPGDIDNDGHVTIADLNEVILHMGEISPVTNIFTYAKVVSHFDN